jgi:hypothetical protein
MALRVARWDIFKTQIPIGYILVGLGKYSVVAIWNILWPFGKLFPVLV